MLIPEAPRYVAVIWLGLAECLLKINAWVPNWIVPFCKIFLHVNFSNITECSRDLNCILSPLSNFLTRPIFFFLPAAYREVRCRATNHDSRIAKNLPSDLAVHMPEELH